MPTITRDYHTEVLETMRDLTRFDKWWSSPINLGGVPGPSGGSGGPPGGIFGLLPQQKVAYDSTEAAYSGIQTNIPSGTLYDNLSHIRFRLQNLETISGLTILNIEQEGMPITTSGVTVLNFTGSGVSVTDTGSGEVTVAISGTGGGISSISIEDEGISQGNATILDFVGDTVTATVNGDEATITVSGVESHTHTENDITDLNHYDSADFDTDFSTKTTNDLAEGTTNLYHTNERVEDVVGGMVTGNTETLITVTYDDADGTLDFIVDEANIDHDSLTNFISQEHIRWDLTGAEDIHDDRIAQSSVTQHESAITITESQISDLNHYTSTDFDTDFGGKSTTDLSEGTNLYFTDERVDDRVNTLLQEGSNITLTYDDVANTLTIASTDTDTQLSEEQVQDFAWNVLTGTQTLITVTYDDVNNEVDFIVNEASIDHGSIAGLGDDDHTQYLNTTRHDSHDHSTALGTAVISDLSDVVITSIADDEVLAYNLGTNEWINQTPFEAGLSEIGHTHTESDITDLDHYTSTDFDTDFSSKSTTDLSEGTNLYYTDERVDDRVSVLIQDGTGISWTYDDVANTLTPTVSLSPFDTGDLSEGANLYFTDERVDDRVNNLLIGGTNVSLTYDDVANTLTIDATDTDTQLSNEEVQDIVGGMVSGNTETLISVSYQDTDGTLDFVVQEASIDHNALTNTHNLTTDIDHDQLTNFVANEHINHSSVSITAGTGLSGGGDITASRTINLNASVNDLTDVFSSTPSDRHVLIYDGVTDNRYENRALVEADISDLSHYTSSDFDTDFSGKSTSDLSEGTNLYFTNERVDDRVNALLIGGDNVTLTYDDVGNSLTINAASSLTTEEVQDIVGGMVSGNTETLISVTYQDGDGTLDFVVDEASIDHDALTNFMTDEHVAHSGVTLTAGVGLTGGGDITTNRTFTLAVDELSEKTGDLVGTDRLTGTSGTTNFSETISSIPLSIFDNDAGFITATLTMISDGDILRFSTGSGKFINVPFHHGAMDGLGDDDHTQYLLVNGNRAMTGSLDMGTNTITNVGNVDGVDISALKTDVDGFPDELKNLTTAEIQQLETINTRTISNIQWGYLGELDQSVKQSANVQFQTVATPLLTGGGSSLSIDASDSININSNKNNVDTIISGDTITNLLLVDASEDAIGIGNVPISVADANSFAMVTVSGVYSSNVDNSGMYVESVQDTASGKTVRGLEVISEFTGNSGTQEGITGLDFTPKITVSGGSVNYMQGISTWAVVDTGTTVNNDLRLINVATPLINGSVATAYGLRIDNITGATNNYAIMTHGGDIVFNEDGTDSDLRVEGDTEPNLLFVDAGNDRIGIGTNTFVSDEGLIFEDDVTGASGVVEGAMVKYVTPARDGAALSFYATKYSSATWISGMSTNAYFQATDKTWQRENTSAGGAIFQGLGQSNQGVIDLYAVDQVGTFWHGLAIAGKDAAQSYVVVNEGGVDMDFRVESSTNPNLLCTDAANDTVILGASSALSAAGLEIVTEEVQAHQLDIYSYHSTSNPFGGISMYNARGNRASPSATQSGDWILNFSGRGYHSGGDWTLTRAYIAAVATENFTSTAQGTRLEFATTEQGTTTRSVNMVIDHDGSIYINETSNINSTLGLTINQGTADDSIFTFKSSDVAHGMTAVVETDTYMEMRKTIGTQGGLQFTGLTEGETGFDIRSFHTTDDTGKSTSADASIEFRGFKKSGTGTVNLGSNANILAIKNRVTTRLVVDSEGDIHYDGSTNANAWDKYDDIKLLTGLRAGMAPAEHELRERFSDWIEDAKPILEETGVVTYNEDGHHFVSTKKLNALMIDAFRQLADRLNRYEELLIEMGIDSKKLESPNNK